MNIRSVYDGSELIVEYNPTGGIARRFVHGPGVDEPLVWYGSSGNTRRFFHADERGSIVAATDSAAALVGINRHDEYGVPESTNIGRFYYTGQAWYPQLSLHHYKNRWRHPKLDRFMQTDPIGYGDGMNMYAYVRGDPVNFVDPFGLDTWWGEAVVTDPRPKLSNGAALLGGYSGSNGGWAAMRFLDGGGGFGGAGASASWGPPQQPNDRKPPDATEDDIVVVARKPTRGIKLGAPHRNTVYFGYPPSDRNSAHHVDRHLTGLDSRQRAALKQIIARDLVPQLPPGRQQIGFVVFNGAQYEYRAFGITNVSTVFRVDD